MVLVGSCGTSPSVSGVQMSQWFDFAAVVVRNDQEMQMQQVGSERQREVEWRLTAAGYIVIRCSS